MFIREKVREVEEKKFGRIAGALTFNGDDYIFAAPAERVKPE